MKNTIDGANVFAAIVGTIGGFILRFFRNWMKKAHRTGDRITQNVLSERPTKPCLLCGTMHSHHNGFCCGDHAREYTGILTVLRKVHKIKHLLTGLSFPVWKILVKYTFYSSSPFIVAVRNKYPKIVIPDVLEYQHS
jgi:hypothetical protein